MDFPVDEVVESLITFQPTDKVAINMAAMTLRAN